MNPPLISVCIPVRNDARHVGAAIDSALAQTDPHLEILVSDNASTDDTWAKVSARQGIVAVRQPQALAMSTHWNWFRQAVRGEWVLFLCSDDLLHPDALARCRQVLAPETLATFFEYDYLVGSELQSKPFFYVQSARIPAREQHGIFIIGNNFPLSMALIRRKLLDQVGWFDEDYNFSTDWELWLKLTADQPEGHIAYLAENLASYRLHESNETGRCVRDRSALAEVIRMKEHYLSRFQAEPERLKEITAASRRGIARLAQRYGDNMAALGEQETAAFYHHQAQVYEAQDQPADHAPPGPPYPLPPGAQPLPLPENTP